MSEIDQISKELAVDRARLQGTLDALTDTVKPKKLAQDVANVANDVGGDLAQKAWGLLRDQPAGGLLVAVGMGLLAAGAERRARPTTTPQPTAVDPQEAMIGFDERVAQADQEIKQEEAGLYEPEHSASSLRSALDSGLDQLPPKARKRVVQAREAVISAQEAVERNGRAAARKTSSFVHQQPLTAGALALGFGVVAGALLPGTRREDAALGAKRDALLADARNVLEDEMSKARTKAEAALARKADLGARAHS